jgi:carboxymethylenebutenolidase
MLWPIWTTCKQSDSLMAEEISEQTVTLAATDGFSFEAFRATPRGTIRGGLVVLQEIFGLTEQMKSVVRSYARDGFDSIFPCVFDRVSPGTVVPFNEPDRGRDLAYGLDMNKVSLDIAAAANCVRGPHGMSVLGFCWGGGVIVRAAADIDLRGAISFYGTRLSNYLNVKAKCPLLFHFGSKDPNSPPETIETVRRTFPNSEIHLYDAGHAFANDVRPTYVADAAATARTRTLAFLHKVHEA